MNLFLKCRAVLHCGVTGDTLIEQKPANPKADEWAERIAAQQRSRISVKQFCKEHGLTEYSFFGNTSGCSSSRYRTGPFSWDRFRQA